MKSKTHIFMANMIIREIKETNGITIPGFGTYQVPEDMKTAILSKPSAFRAGAVGPDFYPDMIVGQSIIHPENSGKWLDIMEKQLRMMPKASCEWNESYAFYLGYLMHYAGDMFGHTYVNKWAKGSFPAISDAIKSPENAKIIMRHILVESYMDERVPKDEDMSIQAPINFLYRCFATPEAMNLYDSDADDCNLLKWMIQLKIDINKKSQDSTIRMGDVFNYFPSWESDIESAIIAWLESWNRIAGYLLTSNGLSKMKDELYQWLDNWGLKLTAIPKWTVTIVKFIGNILDALKLFEPIKMAIKKMFKEILMSLVYAATGLKEEDIDRLIAKMKEIFENPKLYLNSGMLYEEKNITDQLDAEFGNYGSKDYRNQSFVAYDQCLNMCRLAVLGADNANKLISPYYSGALLLSNKQTIPAVSTLSITIKTSKSSWSGTDDNVYFGLVLNDNSVLEILMDKPGYNDFEKGDNDTYIFKLPRTVKYSEIKQIRLRKDYVNFDDDWKMEHITVKDTADQFVLLDANPNVWLKKRTPYYMSVTKKTQVDTIFVDAHVMNHLYSLDGALPEGQPDYKPWDDKKFFLNVNGEVRKNIMLPLFHL